jgi:hypothetical protein
MIKPIWASVQGLFSNIVAKSWGQSGILWRRFGGLEKTANNPSQGHELFTKLRQ